MTKNDIAKKIASSKNVTISSTYIVLDTFIDIITNGLANGEQIKISGLGIFERKLHCARTGRNPHTGEEVAVPEKFGVKFKPSITLKEKLNEAK